MRRLRLVDPYADLLGRECWFKYKKKVRHGRVIAVSWKGAVCLREDADMDTGKHGRWISKENRERLVWMRRCDVPEGLEIVE